MTRALVLLWIAVLGCTQEVQLGADDPFAGLVAITVAPGDRTIELADLAQPPTSIDYVATGEFADGSTRDVTSIVAWRVDNPAPGNFVSGSRYATSQRAAGHVTVNAIAGAVIGTSSLRIVVTTTIIDSTFPPPLGVEALFAPDIPIVTGDPMRSPAVLYPSDNTMFPQGLARLLFQHRGGQNNDAFRLKFESDVLHLTVFTSADRWQPDGATWFLIAASHPAAFTVLSVEGASTTAPGTIYASAPAKLLFARTDPGGLLSFWSAATNGVMRGNLDALTAAPLYPIEGDPTCVGCHTVSRDGAKLAAGYGGEELKAIGLPGLGTLISAPAQRIPMGWATYSPDGTMLLVADRGTLTLRDALTGLPVGTPDGRIALPTKATHPDWSPDGTAVAVALSADISNMEIKSGSIARIPYRDGMFGAPEILVPAAPMSNNYFPRWSPDGKFLAYVSAKTGSRGAISAELRLIRAEGGTPIPLRMASHRIAGVDDAPDLANTMPSWGPPTGDVSWLSFASARPYGAIMPAAARGQIWIAALDLTRVDDPSFAAFWLPSQDVRVLNNNPIWAVTPVISSPAQRAAVK
jgi:hypothetical protein